MHDNPTRRVRVLVTGASGRVGRHVVDALVADHEVTVLDLAPPVQDVRFIEGDVLDLATVRSHVLPLSEAPRGFELIRDGEALKPMLVPDS